MPYSRLLTTNTWRPCESVPIRRCLATAAARCREARGSSAVDEASVDPFIAGVRTEKKSCASMRKTQRLSCITDQEGRYLVASWPDDRKAQCGRYKFVPRSPRRSDNGRPCCLTQIGSSLPECLAGPTRIPMRGKEDIGWLRLDVSLGQEVLANRQLERITQIRE